MNKLYVIKWTLKDGYVISVTNAWNPETIRDKMQKNPEWKFKLEEDNRIHQIWIAS
jgi:uncharacterized protein (DUF2249 family)